MDPTLQYVRGSHEADRVVSRRGARHPPCLRGDGDRALLPGSNITRARKMASIAHRRLCSQRARILRSVFGIVCFPGSTTVDFRHARKNDDCTPLPLEASSPWPLTLPSRKACLYSPSCSVSSKRHTSSTVHSESSVGKGCRWLFSASSISDCVACTCSLRTARACETAATEFIGKAQGRCVKGTEEKICSYFGLRMMLQTIPPPSPGTRPRFGRHAGMQYFKSTKPLTHSRYYFRALASLG